MKIILADDEQMIRLGLINMLEELGVSQSEIFQAKNGRELLKIAQAEKPAAAFIDVKMPVMDGLEALKNMQLVSPSTQCIMLTGYAEFEFARTALSNNASGYLLKPISIPTLRDTLNTITNSMRKKWKQKNAEFSMVLFEKFSTFRDNSGKEIIPDISGPFFLSVVYSNFQGKADGLDQIINRYRDDLGADLSGHYSICHPFIESAVCIITEIPNDSAYLHAKELVSALTDANYYVFSLKADSLEDVISEAYSINERAILRFSTTNRISSLDEIEDNEDLRLFCKCAYETVEALNENNRFLFDGWISRLENIKTSEFDQVLILEAIKYHFPVLNSVTDLSGIASYLRKAGEIQFSTTNANKPSLADAVKSYIDQNYHLDIGTAVIAETFNITPNYLSSIFKKNFDVGLLTYLTRVRMNKAKQLLQHNSSISIHELATSVGYSNSNYFSKVFQKTFGVLPSEFH